ncbi:LOW QUALITY PROTEIN: hypothetical protein ACHAXT_012677 [Thalassiosira profunda]
MAASMTARSLSRAWSAAATAAGSNARAFSLVATHRSGNTDADARSVLGPLLAATGGTVIAIAGNSFSTHKSSAECERPKGPLTRRITVKHDKKFADAAASKHVGDPFPFAPTLNREVPGPKGIPSRAEQVRKLHANGTSDSPYDVLVIGGGATGAGIAFDAATRTDAQGDCPLTVACIERGDFASETSSRSTKLIWAGIKYLASASAALISWDLLTSPIKTVDAFYGEFKMVFNCHQERKYMLEKQRHLTNWVPIVCPFTEWHIWPPPFGHWLFSFFPILAPAVFKFYDGLSQFTCPPSFVMGKKESRAKFPQLNEQPLKYCAVFYEGQHNDARTNLAIALSAAEKGADIANYVEMTEGIFDKEGKVVGVKALDRITGDELEIYAHNVIFAGGPFTDALREKEYGNSTPVKPAGSHIVLPGYYAPKDMGLLDYNTSDGRFLFFLPGSVVVGTTDKKGPAETLPYPPEEEIQWMLKECEKYLSKDLKPIRTRRRGAQVSRDHVISTNPHTDVTFIAGGKWTTWREMAEDALDKKLGEGHPKCNTLDLVLHGGEGYSESLSVQLIQKYGLAEDVAEHLVKTYGGRAWEVAEKCEPTGKAVARYGKTLVDHYPYIEAEEYACTIEDILSRRTRLAFLNSEAAFEALPRVADIMAEELGWSRKIKARQIESATAYLESYGGRIPVEDDLHVRLPTFEEAMDVFREIDRDGSGFLDEQEVKEMTIRLGQPLSDERVKSIFNSMDTNKDGKVEAKEFLEWFTKEETKEGIKSYFHNKTLQIFKEIDTKKKGYLDEEELGDIAVRLGQSYTRRQIKDIFDEMDKDKNGRVEIDEFIAWMDKKNAKDDSGFREMLSAALGLGGTGWLRRKGGGGSFLG